MPLFSLFGLFDMTLDQLDGLTIDGLDQLPLQGTLSPSSGNQFGYGMNLYINGGNPVPSSGNLPLYMPGSTSGTSYYFANIPLYIKGSPLTVGMNLYVGGDPSPIDITSHLNLYIGGHGTLVDNNFPLITYGGYGGGLPVSNNIPLYISGDGSTPGSIPTSSNMNLFLKSPSGTTNTMTMFIQAGNPHENEIDMYIFGVSGSLNNNLNLHLPSIGDNNNKVYLFVRGYIR